VTVFRITLCSFRGITFWHEGTTHCYEIHHSL